MGIRTRFSPSPTGMIHLGNVRAALFSAFFAKKHEGSFILRIEDTDAARSLDEHVRCLQEDLQWLGMKWDEGPGVNGPYGPYWQSQRQAIYEKYYQLLSKENKIYPCFCTDQELALSRKLQLSKGLAPRYAGICTQLSKEEIKSKIEQGKKPTWRFRVPKQTTIEFNDFIKGLQRFQSEQIGDFIIRRADGTAPFLFCNAVDDAEMKISHVLRGEDHVSNTPRQILILQSLALPIPAYGHMPLIMGSDGSPLSKRHGSFSVNDIRAKGYLALAVINYLARLSHTVDDHRMLTFDQLALHFELNRLSKSPARFDLIQLEYWQKIAVAQLDQDHFYLWVGEKIATQIPENKRDLFLKTIKNNVIFPEEVLFWSKIFFHHLHFGQNEIEILKSVHEQFFVEASEAVNKHGTQFNLILEEMKKTLNLTGKKLFLPLRIALTGQTHGPELNQIAELLGAQKMKERFGYAFKIRTEKPL